MLEKMADRISEKMPGRMPEGRVRICDNIRQKDAESMSE